MEYVDEHGQPAYGVVWSPGPMPGTVWVLPESGASKSSALVVKVASRTQVPHAAVRQYLDRYVSDYRDRFKYAPRLANKVWHDALGYDPREVVREDALALDFDVEPAAETAVEPVRAPVPASAPPAAPVVAAAAVEPIAAPLVVKASDPRLKPAGATYKGVHAERYMGHTIRIRRGKEWGTFATSINGHPLGNPYGTTNADAARELAAARGYIDDAIARPGNYHNGLGEYAWPAPGKTTMPRKAQRAAEASSETPCEPVAPAAPPDAPAPSQTSPEPVTVPMAPAALVDVQRSPEAVPVPGPLSIMSSRVHGPHLTVVDHVQWLTWSTMTMITDHDHGRHMSGGGHDPQAVRRVQVPSRVRRRPRPPAPPRHPIQTPYARPPTGHAAHPCPHQMPIRPSPRPCSHQTRSIRACASRRRPGLQPWPAVRSHGPTASGPARRQRPQSGPPGAGPNGVRDEPSLRSPTHSGWLQRAASYRKLVARTRSPDARGATGNW